MIWPRPKPQSIMGIMGLVAILIQPGCVPIKQHEKMVREARIQAFQEAREIMKVSNCSDASWRMTAHIDFEKLKILDLERR